MNPILLWSVALLLVASTASDPTGIYARVDRIVFHPDATSPQHVEIFGAFAIAQGGHGDYYSSPRNGRLVLQAPAGKTAEVLGHWRDIASVAGTGEIVAFSSRYTQADVRVLRGDEQAPPATQGLDFGVRKVQSSFWGSAQALRLLPRPKSPVGDGPKAAAGGRYNGYDVEFVVDNGTDAADVQYVFEIDTGRERVASPPVAPGDGTTKWKTPLFLVAGDKVAWSVRVIGAKVDRGPVAEAEFTVGQDRDERQRR